MTLHPHDQTVEGPTEHFHRNRRILVVDDHPSIHHDFKKILGCSSPQNQELHALTSSLFNLDSSQKQDKGYRITSAYQGEEAIEMILNAQERKQPFSLVFMDINMPPGIDGVKAAQKILARVPLIQIVLVSAYSDYSWEDLFRTFGETQRLLFLGKPFDITVIKQLALVLTCRWSMDTLSRIMIREITASDDSAMKKAQYLEDLFWAHKLPCDKDAEEHMEP